MSAALYVAIFAIGLVAVAVFAVWLGRRSSKDAGQAKQLAQDTKKVADDAKKASDIRADVQAASDAERRERLQPWVRD